MSPTEQAVARVAGFLEQQSVPYMLIGGMATLVWGRLRATADVDFKVAAADGQELLRACRQLFELRASEPERFLAETRTIPLRVQAATGEAVSADLVLAGLPYEIEAIRRGLSVRIGGRLVRVATAEDLILHKIISERPRDIEDVRGILEKQGSSLDRDYLEPKLKELAEALARPEIWTLYDQSRKARRC